MGPTFSRLETRPGAPNEPNSRTRILVQDIVPGLSVPPTMGDLQVHSPPQNRPGVDELLFPSPRQRKSSNRAVSSNGYDASTTVGTEGSPSSYRHTWDGGFTFTNTRSLPLEDNSLDNKCPDGRQAFQRHLKKPSLEVICPELNEFLRTITDSSECQECGQSTRFSFSEPYEPIFHNRKILQGHEAADPHVKQHIHALLKFIQKRSPLTWEKLDDIEGGRCYSIAFKDLWLLYPPGTTVFNRDDDGAWRAYKVDRVETYSESNLERMLIHCCFLDFDTTGQWLVPHVKTFHIPSYSLERPIRNLDVLPGWCRGALGQRLAERGKTYWEYGRNVFFKRYDGNAWPRISQEEPINVVIDYVTSSKHQQDTGLDEPHYTGVICSICEGKAIQLGSYPTNAPHDSDICERRQAGSRTYNTDLPLMFCPARLWAFSLRHKSWKMISPRDLREIQTQSESFEKLQMEKEQKKVLERLLCGYLKNGRASSSLDLVSGKGQGLKVLFHGNPGTGKTLTVESLCEKHKIPLYMLTCGELGSDTDTFEDRLQRAFLRAANWGAVLLLEEADIFVRNREQNIQHCAIVSSFLNKLDYSRAMVFMTTNRVSVFDTALLSRIHIKLKFPDIDFAAQKEIWKDAINRLQDVNAQDKEALRYWVGFELETLDGRKHTMMNGRQIRKCINAASALAHGNRDGDTLKDIDIKTILRLGKDFMEYLACQEHNPDINSVVQKNRQEELAQQV